MTYTFSEGFDRWREARLAEFRYGHGLHLKSRCELSGFKSGFQIKAIGQKDCD
jgi:hypothetical protein